MSAIIVLHSAQTTPAMMKALVGPVDGFNLLFPQATTALRWDHLGPLDVPKLLELDAEFIAGYSSGAFMAARMIQERQYRGAMLLAGGFIKTLKPRPTPLMLVNGTADSQVPYDGTTYVRGALDTAITMRKLLGITTAPTRYTIPNTNKLDGCTATLDSWAGKVNLYTVIGGGHCWPGSKYNAAGLGRVCQDFSATAKMCDFFRPLAQA